MIPHKYWQVDITAGYAAQIISPPHHHSFFVDTSKLDLEYILKLDGDRFDVLTEWLPFGSPLDHCDSKTAFLDTLSQENIDHFVHSILINAAKDFVQKSHFQDRNGGFSYSGRAAKTTNEPPTEMLTSSATEFFGAKATELQFPAEG